MTTLKPKGSALLSALFITTLVAIAATAMSTRMQLDIYRTKLSIDSDKMNLTADAATFWAIEKIHTKKIIPPEAPGKSLVATAPTELETITPELRLTASLYDLQSRFNLNNVDNKTMQPIFLNLLTILDEKSSPTQNRKRVQALMHWVAPKKASPTDKALLEAYLSQDPPYLPGFQPLSHVSEYRLIPGVTQKRYRQLQPYITALPQPTPINLNTAPKKLLRALGPMLTDSQVNELIEARGSEGFKDLKKVEPLLKRLGIPDEQITLKSQYFLVVTTVQHNELTLRRYTLLKRTLEKKKPVRVDILNESLSVI